MDREFQYLQSDLSEAGIPFIISAKDEHVSEIEQFTRTFKEKMEINYKSFPFKILPNQIIIEMFKKVTFC
jgi:hypothetical protein